MDPGTRGGVTWALGCSRGGSPRGHQGWGHLGPGGFQGWVTQVSPGVGSPWGVPGLTQGGHQGGVHKGPNFDVRSVSVGPARLVPGELAILHGLHHEDFSFAEVPTRELTERVGEGMFCGSLGAVLIAMHLNPPAPWW